MILNRGDKVPRDEQQWEAITLKRPGEEAASGTWPELGLERGADYRIERGDEAIAYQGPASVDSHQESSVGASY